MNFKEFLLKYSTINSKFLTDFYNIVREDYIERYNEFLIDSEILRIWLQIKNRRIFNDTIKRSYKQFLESHKCRLISSVLISSIRTWRSC